ncbi:hypothetical protein C8J98_104237 [Luteibacter sp. OK325]|nr:hypothetical protein C8J98_104237 [Luteibacter sp. OK325]
MPNDRQGTRMARNCVCRNPLRSDIAVFEFKWQKLA